MCNMDEKANKIIDALNGTSAVAELCECTPSAVSQWRRVGIPDAQMRYLRVIRPRVVKPIEKAIETDAKA